MAKIVVEGTKLENLVAQISNIPALISSAISQIHEIHVNEDCIEEIISRRSKERAVSLAFILEDYIERVSKDLENLFDTAEKI